MSGKADLFAGCYDNYCTWLKSFIFCREFIFLDLGFVAYALNSALETTFYPYMQLFITIVAMEIKGQEG